MARPYIVIMVQASTTRDVMKFELEFDNVRTSDIFSRFKI